MSRNRRNRLLTVLFALVSLLYMQVAVAAYACSGAGSKTAESAAMAAADMPCADFMAMSLADAQPSLCHAHCQASSQSSQTPQLPSLVAVDALPAVPVLLVAPLFFLEAPLQPAHLQRTTAPPLAIRNCCFRL